MTHKGILTENASMTTKHLAIIDKNKKKVLKLGNKISKVK